MWEPLTAQIKEMKLLREYVQVFQRRNHHTLNLLALQFNCSLSVLESVSAALSTDVMVLDSSRRLHDDYKYHWSSGLIGFQNKPIKFKIEFDLTDKRTVIGEWFCDSLAFFSLVYGSCTEQTMIQCFRKFDKWLYNLIRVAIYWRWFCKSLYVFCRKEQGWECELGYRSLYVYANVDIRIQFNCDGSTIYVGAFYRKCGNRAEGRLPIRYASLDAAKKCLKNLARTGNFYQGDLFPSMDSSTWKRVKTITSPD